MGVFALDQAHYRWRDNDDANADSPYTWLAAEDTVIYAEPLADQDFRIRFSIHETGNATGSADFSLEMRVNGGSWTAVTPTSSPFQDGAAPPTDADAITSQQLTGSAGDWLNGEYSEDGQTATLGPFDKRGDTEVEYAISYVGDSQSEGDYVELRVTDGGSALGAYSQTPRINFNTILASPATFSLGAPSVEVAQGQTVSLSQTVSAVTAIAFAAVSFGEITPQLSPATFSLSPPALTVMPIIRLAASDNIAASGENTTAQLTAPSGKTTGDFVTGRMQDDENPADAIDITADDYTELEWCIEITDAVEPGATYEFRVTKNGSALDTYSVTPTITHGTGAQTVSVSAATVPLAAPAADKSLGEIQPALSPATFSMADPAVAGFVFGEITVGLSAATLSLVGPATQPGQGYFLSPAPFATTAVSLAPTFGELQLGLSPATLPIAGPAIASLVQNQTINLSTPATAVAAASINPVSATILVEAGIGVDAVSLAGVAFGEIQVGLSVATVSLSAPAAEVPFDQTAALSTPTITLSAPAVTDLPALRLALSDNIGTSGRPTTAQLTAPAGKTTANFTVGRIQDDENPADAIDIASGNYSEFEWCLEVTTSAELGAVYEFRVTKAGTVLDTYTVTPTVTVAGLAAREVQFDWHITQTVSMSAATISLAAPTATPSVGEVPLQPSPISVQAPAITTYVAVGINAPSDWWIGETIYAAAPTLSVQAPALADVVPEELAVSLSPATVSLASVASSPVGTGEAIRPISASSFAVRGVAPEIVQPGVVFLSRPDLSVVAPAVTPSFGEIQVGLSAAEFSVAPVAATIIIGGQIESATLSVVAPPLTYTETPDIEASAATLSLVAPALTIPGERVTLSAATVSFTGETMTIGRPSGIYPAKATTLSLVAPSAEPVATPAAVADLSPPLTATHDSTSTSVTIDSTLYTVTYHA